MGTVGPAPPKNGFEPGELVGAPVMAHTAAAPGVGLGVGQLGDEVGPLHPASANSSATKIRICND